MPPPDPAAIEWKPIPNFGGYEVSNYGGVRSFRDSSGTSELRLKVDSKVMRTRIINGYPVVDLRKERRKYKCKVSRLVLFAFVGPPPDGMICRHLDGNRENNFIGNLKWGTTAENEADKVRHGTKNTGVRNGISKINDGTVRKIREMANLGVSDFDIAKEVGLDRSGVGRIKRGKAWKHVPI